MSTPSDARSDNRRSDSDFFHPERGIPQQHDGTPKLKGIGTRVAVLGEETGDGVAWVSPAKTSSIREGDVVIVGVK